MAKIKDMRVYAGGSKTSEMHKVIKLTDEFDIEAAKALISEGKITEKVVELPFRYRGRGMVPFMCIVPSGENEKMATSWASWISDRAQGPRNAAQH